jgi:hypothetical protein
MARINPRLTAFIRVIRAIRGQLGFDSAPSQMFKRELDDTMTPKVAA